MNSSRAYAKVSPLFRRTIDCRESTFYRFTISLRHKRKIRDFSYPGVVPNFSKSKENLDFVEEIREKWGTMRERYQSCIQHTVRFFSASSPVQMQISKPTASKSA